MNSLIKFTEKITNIRNNPSKEGLKIIVSDLWAWADLNANEQVRVIANSIEDIISNCFYLNRKLNERELLEVDNKLNEALKIITPQ